MKRIAIIGGGIAGLSAAYELALQQHAGAPIEFVLFDAASRLGGIVETVRRDGFVIECGPDSWVTEKPWARDLALELGLESELVPSRDDRRKTYLVQGRALTAMPDGMRLMVPVQWAGVLNSPLFSWQAKLAYLREPKLAELLKTSAIDAAGSSRDESVRDFVFRHFGAEVADTIAAPLLAGVFGGDIAMLSARAVLPAFVALERDYGSLVLGLQQRRQAGDEPAAIFTTLRHGLAGLVEGMESHIPASSIQSGIVVASIDRTGEGWVVHRASVPGVSHPASQTFDAVLVATPAKTTAQLFGAIDERIEELLPQQSSSAIVVALAFSADRASAIRIPRGFGFLVPQIAAQYGPSQPISNDDVEAIAQSALLACTFVDQKFPQRAPKDAVLLRAFFGGPAVAPLLEVSDATLLRLAQTTLGRIVGKLPEPSIALVRRWPDSLPLYSVGHLDRMAELDARISRLPHMRLIGNAYRGVGLPDLIHTGRTAARELTASLTGA